MLSLLLMIGYAALFLLLIRRWRIFRETGFDWRVIGGIFLLKIVFGTGLWAIYTFHYSDRANIDIYKYFDDGHVMFSALPDHPMDYVNMLSGLGGDDEHLSATYYKRMNNWYRQYDSPVYNDAHTVIRFNALVSPFAFGRYHVHTVFMCFLSLFGGMGIFHFFKGALRGKEMALLAACLLVPSVIFWSSGVLKEGLLFFALGWFLWSVRRVLDAGWRKELMVQLVMSSGLLLILKIYVLACLLPGLFIHLWTDRSSLKVSLFRTTAVVVVAGLVVLNLDLVFPDLNVLEILRVKQKDFIAHAIATDTRSLVEVTPLSDRLSSFVLTAPHALYISLVAPLLHLSGGALGVLAALENLFMLLAIGTALYFRRPLDPSSRSLLLLCTCFCIALALLIGWTTPVLGAVVRYRAPLLPFFFIIALLCMDAHAAKKKFPWTQLVFGP